MSDSNVPDYKNAVLVSVEEGITVPDWIERVEPFVRRVLETMNIERWELSVMFCSDAFIKQLNEQYRSIDSPTDVLSFEQNSTYISDDGVEWFSAGDIVISIDTLFKNVEQFSVTPDEELKRLLMGIYGFQKVAVEVICKAPSSHAAPAGGHPVSAPAAPSGGKGEKAAPGKVLMGRPIRVQPVPMKILDLKMGNATVAGKVFAFECRETRRPGMWRLSFDMTDYTNSVTVQKNLTEKEAQGLESAIKPGMWLCVQGKMEPTWDGKDIQLNPYHIQLAEHAERQDTAPEKRVELHLHTKMSNMDALTDTKEVVQQAIRWGHPAIAITDHGVAQSFPDAWHAAGDKIKILYGVEGYFVNNIDDRVVVHGPQDCSLDGEFVCFDIETTGLKVDREAITEIGAVVLRDGQVAERFQT